MNLVTLAMLLLIAAVIALGWLLLRQRQRVASETLAMLPADLHAIIARAPVPPPPAATDQEMEPMSFPADNAARPHDAGSALFPASEAQELRRHWDTIQASFVDEPAKAVEDAERLIRGAVERLTQALSAARQDQGANGAGASTEDLRLTLKSYKALLSRLL